MANAPVQLVLNSAQFRADRDAPGGGGGHDFYAGRDAAFAEHRDALVADLTGIVAAEVDKPLIHLRVMMRGDALAKSHRPFGSLFRARLATHVGTQRYGELIFATTSTLLGEVRDLVASAEEIVATEVDQSGKERPVPSKERSEVSAIQSVSLWSPELARRFSLNDAEEWLAQAVLPGLRVSTFALPEASSTNEALQTARRASIAAHATLNAYISETDLVSYSTPLDALPSVQTRFRPPELSADRTEAALASGTVAEAEQRLAGNRSSMVTNFRQILADLESSAVVREVSLDEDVDDWEYESEGFEANESAPPPPSKGRAIVGVIDGGVAGYTDSAVVGRSGVVDDYDKIGTELNHGSGIASLIAWGHWFNPYLVADDACDVYDLDLIPAKSRTTLYYSSLEDLLGQIRSAVRRARDEAGVRVFNLSYRFRTPPGSRGYSHAAEALDTIALAEDVLFVISAGNLSMHEQRDPWPLRGEEVPLFMAGDRSVGGVYAPAESLTNLSVAAVNPPGLFAAVEHAPTQYTPRGIHTPSANKPDLAEVGGAAPSKLEPSNLSALDATGNRVSVHGTSFAAPLAARKAAGLDAAIQGAVSRETLIALMTHFSTMPSVFTAKSWKDAHPYGRSLVGHGIPATVEQMLEGVASEMTFVIHDTLLPGRRIQFPITWPAALTTADGKSQGEIRLTLVHRPLLDPRHGDERVRVNVEAALQQANGDGFRGQAKETHVLFTGIEHANERERITALGKWYPLKTYATTMPLGRGESPDWRVDIGYQMRSNTLLPDEGVPFSLVLTISDPSGDENVFNEIRSGLISSGAQLQDLRTAIRVEAAV
ncbi:subtilase family protein [Curtobacterium sp. PhB142]|uniref:S8 family serine peptidase n=1 Tax=unclassified Curtobacterium TaxID=257496 RepID=UPI0010494025|nr:MULTISPECIES: S8 family serine peptidase [unclassified Curtobacterium]TCL83502.1 subtilase family protein [Curtobacterium sp. PhB142]TCM01023.1 subtilase family protein [Curtobacterium sp. PhB134]